MRESVWVVVGRSGGGTYRLAAALEGKLGQQETGRERQRRERAAGRAPEAAVHCTSRMGKDRVFSYVAHPPVAFW